MNTQQEKDIFIECKDHTVSQETFQLLYDEKYDMLVTTPKPEKNELKKYYQSEDYISHTDHKRSIFEKIYHLVKSYTLKKKVQLITNLHQGKGKVLDIGAGTGDFLATAKNKGWSINGVEPSNNARGLAKEKDICLNPGTIDYVSENFDVITLWHVLEHIPDLKDQIKEIHRLLKANGYVIVAVPNYKSYDAEYYKSFWAAYDVPRHLSHFSKQSIELLFKEEGFVLEKVKPMLFDAFYVSLLSEKYKNGSMNPIRAFFVGLYSNIKAKSSKQYSSQIYILKKM